MKSSSETVEELKILLDKSNERLRNSEVRIRTLIQTIPVGLLMTNQQGIIEVASPASLELFHCNYNHLSGRDLRELFLFEEPMVEDIFISAQKQTKELMALRADGSSFPAAIKVSSFAKSSVLGFLVVIEDISAKREVERLRQEFISMITHDLRTPLTSIQCFLNLITDGVFDDRVAMLKGRTAEVEQETSRLIDMINNLLNLNKLEAGHLELCPDVMPVRSIIKRSVHAIADLAASRGVDLQVMEVPDSIQVDADVKYTVQVLVNLLSNALKFSPPGTTVSLWAEELDQFVKINVRDQGKGIPAEFQSRLFNRFEQAHMSDARVHGGSGLGLAISKAIVEQQGGKIGVYSEMGKGCLFWFTVPTVAVD